VPATASFDYALIRVVPRVEREEFVNAGVILFCLERDFLAARTSLDEARVHALWPEADVALLAEHLRAVERICAGEGGSGPIGRLSARERFHWLVAPRSTVLQVSPVHSGLCQDPLSALEDLMQRMVRMPVQRGDAPPSGGGALGRGGEGLGSAGGGSTAGPDASPGGAAADGGTASSSVRISTQ